VDLTVILLVNLSSLALLMFGVWLLSLVLRDVSIVDVFWGLGFFVVATVSLAVTDNPPPRAWLIASLAWIWGLRLAVYLGLRKVGKPEDYRYRALRESHGNKFWITSLGLVFGLQAVLIWVISWPLQLAPHDSGEWNAWDIVGVMLWGIGFVFEAVGDYQMARFKANPANHGKVFSGGLWKYTRHPNYFGDFLVWWGLTLLAFAGGAPWWIIVSPLTISFLLIRVSGVTLLEKSLKQRSPGYEEYMRRTSSFFPWPPRKG
jgi:steroid 5-alpha reductase family enzyme